MCLGKCEWVFDLEKDTCCVPVELGIGKVLKVNNIVFNIFAEPQFAILHEGVGQPEVQLFIGLNTQFTGL